MELGYYDMYALGITSLDLYRMNGYPPRAKKEKKKEGNLSTKKLFFLLMFLLKLDGELLFHPADLRCARIIECKMSGILNTSNVSSRNEAFKRPSSDTRDQNSSKRQTMADNHVQMLPGSKLSVSKYSAFHVFQSTKQDSGKNHVLASSQDHKFVGDASGVDAEKCCGGGDVAKMETQLKEKLPSSSDVVKYTVPDLNETAPETESSADDDKGPNFGNVSSLITGFGGMVKIIRELETKGHLKEEFRLKFLTWYGLRATANEREVVCAFIRTINDDLSSLAGQLIDFFSHIKQRRS